MGLLCRHNDISALDEKGTVDFTLLVNALPPIGHGEALTYPDDMWKEWSYKDSNNKKRARDNKEVFYNIIQKIPEYLDELGINNTGMDEAKAKKYKPIFAMKKNHEKEFDKITQAKVTGNPDISYKYWRDLTLRGVQSKDNIFIKKNSATFASSEWFLFQKIAKDIRNFFRNEIFPKLIIKTKVY